MRGCLCITVPGQLTDCCKNRGVHWGLRLQQKPAHPSRFEKTFTPTPAVLGCACAQSVMLLQFGGAEEYAALAGLFPSKTSAAPPSKADLAAMGEDFEGLSREEMLDRIEHPRPSPASEPLCNGKAWNTEAAGNPRLRAPRALHGPPIAPAPRVLA